MATMRVVPVGQDKKYIVEMPVSEDLPADYIGEGVVHCLDQLTKDGIEVFDISFTVEFFR